MPDERERSHLESLDVLAWGRALLFALVSLGEHKREGNLHTRAIWLFNAARNTINTSHFQGGVMRQGGQPWDTVSPLKIQQHDVIRRTDSERTQITAVIRKQNQYSVTVTHLGIC
jgi:hypothetical protein